MRILSFIRLKGFDQQLTDRYQIQNISKLSTTQTQTQRSNMFQDTKVK